MDGSGRSALVGRDHELSRLRAFLDEPALFPRAVLLEGEPGIGKTTLVRAAVEAARERSYRVLACNPGPAETQIALGALGDLLADSHRDELPHLPEPQRRALRIALLLEQPSGRPPDQRATFTAVLGLLRRLARANPVIVVVDDIHFLDPGSAACLEFVARRLGNDAVGLVLSLRAGWAPELSGRLEAALGPDRFERMHLGPMSLAALHHLQRDRLDISFPRPTLRRIHHEARGNPLLALEIGRALREHPEDVAIGEPLPVPTEMRDLLTARLDALPPETRQTLLFVSAHANATLALLERAVGPEARERLEPALASHVLEWNEDRLRFTHPMLSSTVHATAAAADRRAVHRRLAEVVRHPEVRARHLALATEGPDADVADVLEDAAAGAAGRGLPSEAADLTELAVRLTPEDRVDDIRRRRSDAAGFHFTAGRVERSREIRREILGELTAGPERSRTLLGLGSSESDLRISASYCEQALDEAPDDPRLRASARHLLAFLSLGVNQVPEARAHAAAAVAEAERAGDQALLAQALSAEMFTDAVAGVEADAEVADRALTLERGLDVPLFYPPSLSHARRLTVADRLDDARAAFEATYRRSRETGDEAMQALTLMHWTELECRAGDFSRAAELAETGYVITQQMGFEGRQAPLLYASALAASRLGRADEARRLGEEGAALARRYGMVLSEMQAEAVLGFLDLSLGDAAAAAERLRPLPERLERGGYGEPSVCPAAPDAIEALVAVGELDEARRFQEGLERTAEAAGSRWGKAAAARGRGSLSAAEGDVEGAAARFAEALELHRRLPEPFERARTLFAQGTALRRARRKRNAREALEQARGIFEQLGAALWQERAAAELDRIGGRTTSPEGLTPAERRVATLVATGLSNNEVASKLVVSVHTIETHLSKIYAKLGIRSRTQLARRIMGEHEDGS